MFKSVSTSVAVPCGNPLTIPNGSRTFTGTTFRETATYTCNTGYQLSDPSTVTCQASGNWSTEPTCTRKILNFCCMHYTKKQSHLRFHAYVSLIVAVPCGDPPIIPNGSRTFTGTTFGDTITYTCNPGYQRSGSATVICQAIGSWSTRPTCPSRMIRKLY